jgi:orotate phosphoribosyltransferase
MTRSELACRIYDVAHLDGEFRLRSGATSHEYFDKYRFESDPTILRAVAEHLHPLVPAETEAIAGLEMGGIPIATILSQLTGLPALFIRKQAKEYGTCRFAEGGEVRNRRLLLIEDVVTSGGAVIEAARALRSEGAHVDGALCVIDRESGGLAKLAAENIPMTALFKSSELKN